MRFMIHANEMISWIAKNLLLLFDPIRFLELWWIFAWLLVIVAIRLLLLENMESILKQGVQT